jgi:CRISPR/Cas system-associated endonuclease Cas1
MSYHILHLLSHNLRVRLKLDQLQIKDTETGEERAVPLADINTVVCAARDAEFTAGALRRMAELNVLLIVCNENPARSPCPTTAPPAQNCSAAKSNGRPSGKKKCGGKLSPPR